jgi:hypothetical protein
MSPLLPVKKIYVDSKFRTPDSESGSNFKFNLPFSITLPRECIFMMDDICIPHSWFSVEPGFNDSLYMWFDFGSGVSDSHIFTIPQGNYNPAIFAAALQLILNTAFLGAGFPLFTVSLDAAMGNLSITFSLPAHPNTKIRILTDDELSTRFNNKFDARYDIQNPASINDILGNYGTSTVQISTDHTTLEGNTTYTSGFLTFSPIDTLYISSPNLGTFTTLSPTGSQNVIKKIPVAADYGYMIIDRITSAHDYLECGNQTLRSLEFNLRDGRGNNVPLHGRNISFSIVFSTLLEDR